MPRGMVILVKVGHDLRLSVTYKDCRLDVFSCATLKLYRDIWMLRYMHETTCRLSMDVACKINICSGSTWNVY